MRNDQGDEEIILLQTHIHFVNYFKKPVNKLACCGDRIYPRTYRRHLSKSVGTQQKAKEKE